MVTPKLSPTPQLAQAAALIAALTVLGLLAALADPRLAGTTPPHPALRGTAGEAAAILVHNLRVLAAPFALWLLGLPKTRVGRHAGDLLVLSLAGLSAVPVGLELGRWRGQLIPYLPHLPTEWAALTVTTSAWLTARTDTAHPRQLAALAAAAGALLLIAASLETWATPHRTARPPLPTVNGTAHEPCARGGRGWLPSPRIMRRTATPLQGHKLPSPRCRSVPLGRKPGAPGPHQPPRTPQGGTT